MIQILFSIILAHVPSFFSFLLLRGVGEDSERGREENGKERKKPPNSGVAFCDEKEEEKKKKGAGGGGGNPPLISI